MPLRIVQPRVVLDDPHACTDASDVLALFSGLFDTLVRPGRDGYVAGLAERWDTLDDARSTTFHLRRDVVFHDGTACDAEAVRLNLERMARPEQGATLGAPGVWSQYLAGAKVEALASHTVRLTTAAPLADILDIVGAGNIVSPSALAAGDLGARMVGTGPYALDTFEAGQRAVLRADHRCVTTPPRHDRVKVTADTDPRGRLSALVSGRVEVANGLPADIERRVDPTPATVCRYIAPAAIIVMFNCASGPAADPRVRRALDLAVDRPALVRDVLAGAGDPLHGFVSRQHWAHDASVSPRPVDRPEARRLLREAGFGDGMPLALFAPTRLPDEAPALVAALTRQLAEVGVAVVAHTEADRVAYAEAVRAKRIHDACVFDSSPMSAFRVLAEKICSRVRGSWWQGYANPVVEALIDRGRGTVDHDARMALYRAAYRALQEDPPWLTLYTHARYLGLAGRHPGFSMRADGVLDIRALP